MSCHAIMRLLPPPMFFSLKFCRKSNPFLPQIQNPNGVQPLNTNSNLQSHQINSKLKPAMGNQVSRRTATTTGKVIFSDGTVQTLDQDNPTSVAELMLDHPQHVVVEFQPPPKSKPSNTTCTNSKPTPLPADHKLEPTKIYVMVPMKRARTTSMGTIAQIIKQRGIDHDALLGKTTSTSNLPLLLMMMGCSDHSATAVVSTNTCLPSRSEKGNGNSGKKDNSLGLKLEEKKELEEEEEDDDDDDELTLKENQMRPEFMNTQFSSKRWKPNLDPIEEKVKSSRALLPWLL